MKVRYMQSGLLVHSWFRLDVFSNKKLTDYKKLIYVKNLKLEYEKKKWNFIF